MAKDKSQIVKCPSCGANMTFDIKSGKLMCPYCGTTHTLETNWISSRNYYTYKEEGEVNFDGVVCRCPNCYSEIVITDFETAKVCPFCGSTNIQKTDTLPGLKPDGILPFQISQEEASNIALNFVKKRLYAPRKLKKQFAVDKFKGVYIPSFIFNAKTSSTYEGSFGEYYYVTVGEGEDEREERRVRYYYVSGIFDKDFKNLVVEASTHITQKILNKLMPIDYENAVSYDSRYLAGMQSERYSVSLEECFDYTKGIMSKDIRRCIIGQYNPDVVQYLNITTNYNPVTFKYVLVPIWVCTYTYRKKIYTLYINGRTGKARGYTPVSVVKVLITLFVVLGVVAVALYFLLKELLL